MPKVDVYDIKGKKVSDIELADSVFGIEPNENIVHAVLVNYLANQRQGTQSTKTRAEVRGGGKKPWRQKGTGRARQGSIRAPQWIKGGIALGPKPRSYKYTVNKKERRLAIKSILSSKVLEKELTVADKLELAEIKTKTMVQALSDLKVEGTTLIILPEQNKNVLLSARNIEGVKTILINNINVFDLLKYNNLVFPDAFLKRWVLATNKNLTKETLEEDFPKMIEDLKWQLIKNKIVKKFEIKVENEDVEEYAKKITEAQFAQYGMVGMDDEMISNYAKEMLKKEETLKGIVDRVIDNKVYNTVKQVVTINTKDVTIEEFNKFFEN